MANSTKCQEDEPTSSLKDFKDMCDLMFKIARENDDIEGNKANYLNKHIAAWIYPKEKTFSRRRKHTVKNSNSNSTSRQHLPTPPPAQPSTSEKQYEKQFCYHCALPLYPGHAGHYEGVHATCRYCGTKGHVKAACGKLGNLPARNYTKRGSPVTEDMCDPKAKCIGHKCAF